MLIRLAFTVIFLLGFGFLCWKYLRKWWQEGKQEERRAVNVHDEMVAQDKVVELNRWGRKYNAVKDVNVKKVTKQKKKVKEILDL